jgi:GT2 family glycosyltransferase
MKENLIKIEVVIPVYNRRETTLQCLKSLSRIDKTSLKVHIIIVDDGSPDKTGEAIEREFPEVQVIYGDGTLHYAAGTNRGISAALQRKPDFIVTMNDDAVLHEQFLQRLVKTAKNNPRAVVGGLLLLWNEPHKVFQVDFKWKTLGGGWTTDENLTAFNIPQAPFEVEGLAGNCIIYPVEAIKECGLMDEQKFPHGWGDIQYVVRMRKKGWKLMVDPKSYIWCEPNTNPKPLHYLKPKEIIRTLFVNQRHPANLKRQFIARWESAPNKTQALSGFFVYLAIIFAKTIKFAVKKTLSSSPQVLEKS